MNASACRQRQMRTTTPRNNVETVPLCLAIHSCFFFFLFSSFLYTFPKTLVSRDCCHRPYRFRIIDSLSYRLRFPPRLTFLASGVTRADVVVVVARQSKIPDGRARAR